MREYETDEILIRNIAFLLELRSNLIGLPVLHRLRNAVPTAFQIPYSHRISCRYGGMIRPYYPHIQHNTDLLV